MSSLRFAIISFFLLFFLFSDNIKIKNNHSNSSIVETISDSTFVSKTVDKILLPVEKYISQEMDVQSNGARVQIPEGAMVENVKIEIEKLNDLDLPPLSSGMINVTAENGGYRFLPAGTTFEKPITIEIPLKEKFAFNNSSVRTYYWDEKINQWFPLKKVFIENKKNLIVSKAKHFTIMINAILTPPDNPPPLMFNPNTIKDIAAVDPSSEIDLIEPPQANNKGTAEINFPIKLPKGRGAYSPQITLSYSSARGNGFIGTGWDMMIPMIEVDTRWGVPTYKEKSERYLLNGAAIVPIAKSPKLSCNIDINTYEVYQQYAKRNEDFERISLCKNPITKETHWEVTSKDGTRFEYGSDENSRLTSYYKDEESHTANWFLRRVVDANGNVTSYNYEQDTNLNDYEGEPFVQKYLQSIEYTSHVSSSIPVPAYRVDFDYYKGETSDPHQNIVINCKSGFKVVTRYLLKDIEVYFTGSNQPQGKLIRRYILKYEKGGKSSIIGGAFRKILLSKIKVQGSDKSDFYNHSFTYSEEVKDSHGNKKFSNQTKIWENPESDIYTLKQSDRLLNHTSEESHSFGGGVGASFEFQAGSAKAGCSAGISGKGTWETPKPQVALIDVNGDNISDRIWRNGGQVKALLGKQDNNKFILNSDNKPFMVNGISHIGTEDAKGGMIGLNASCTAQWGSLKAGISAGMSISSREVDSNSLLTDVDGDGIIDLAYGSYFYRGLPRRCRDGSQPASGICEHGISICPDDQNLYFEGDKSLSNLASVYEMPNMIYGTLPNKSSYNLFEDQNDGLLASLNRNSTNFHNTFGSSDPVFDSFYDIPDLSSNLSIPESHISPLEPIPQSNTVESIDWDRFTAKRLRLEKEPHLKAEMYRLNPVIRWDARHDGTVELKALAKRKFNGGKDGIKVVVLHVTDPAISTGTRVLGTVQLLPDNLNWAEVPGSGKINVKFEEALLFIVDTIDDVPVDADGNLVDEVELDVEIKYTQVNLPGQPLHNLKPEDLNHKDATGQLAYYYHFPSDLRTSELPRDSYWQLLPPLGPPRINPNGTVDKNRIIGTITKKELTDSPVHVRIRCESMNSTDANDNTICPLATILYEHIFSPEELDSLPFKVDLPSPWVEKHFLIDPEEFVAIVSNDTSFSSTKNFNNKDLTIGVPSESIERFVTELFPKAIIHKLYGDIGVEYTEYYLANLLKNKTINVYITEYKNASALFTEVTGLNPIPNPPPGEHNYQKVRDVAYLWPSVNKPLSITRGRPTYLYDPMRLLFEVDGENGAEIHPNAVEWKPHIEIVSLYDLEEVREPSIQTPVVLISRNSKIGKNARSYEELNTPDVEYTVQIQMLSSPNDEIPNLGVIPRSYELAQRRFPNALFTLPTPLNNSEELWKKEAGYLGLQVIKTVQGDLDLLVAEYGDLLETIAKVEELYWDCTKKIPIEVKKYTHFLGLNDLPRSMYGSIRALVRDEQIIGNNNEFIHLYDYDDLNRPEVTIAYATGSYAEMAVKHWENVKRKILPNIQDALQAVMNGEANALIADAEFIETAIKNPEIASKTFIGFKRGNLHDINTDVAYIRRADPVIFDKDQTWKEKPKILYRVHPARQLIPFYSYDDNQKLEITVEGINFRKPMIVTATGEKFDGEVARWEVKPDDYKWFHTLTGNKIFYKKYVTNLPKAGLYYVRGYSEAGFDKTTINTLKAKLLDVQSKPHLALIHKELGSNIQNYSDLNYSNVTIVIEKDSFAESIVDTYFPSVNLHYEETRELALKFLLESNDATAMIADAGFIQSQITNPNVSSKVFQCCPPNDAVALLPDISVPANLLTAKFGGGHRGQHLTMDTRNKMQTLEKNVTGEVPYSQDPWGGGHHGFFYGEIRGDIDLHCIGSVYCDDRSTSTTSILPDSKLEISDSDFSHNANNQMFATLSLRPNYFISSSNTSNENNHNLSNIVSLSGDHIKSQKSIIAPVSLLFVPLSKKVSPKIVKIEDKRSPQGLYKGAYADFDNADLTVWTPKGTLGEGIAYSCFKHAKIRSFDSSQIKQLVSQLLKEDKRHAIIASTSFLKEIIEPNTELRMNSSHIIFEDKFSLRDSSLITDDTVYLPFAPALIPKSTNDSLIIIDPYPDCNRDLDGDGVNDCVDLYPFAAGDREGNGCPSGTDSGRKEPDCPDKEKVDVSANSCLWEYLTAFYPMDGNKNCFTGSDPTSRVCKKGVHSTRNNSFPYGGDGNGNGGGTIDGALRRSQNIGVNADVGAHISLGMASFGINANYGVSSDYGELEYMDWNGDGLPDVNSPNVIYLTGRNEEPVILNLDCQLYDFSDSESNEEDKCLSYPGIRESRNTTMGLAMSLGPSAQFQQKMTPDGSAKELGWDNIDGGIGVHAQTSMSVTKSDRFDINGDGLPDIVLCKTENEVNYLKVRLNLGYRLGEEEDWGKIESVKIIDGKLAGKLSNTLKSAAFSDALSRSDNLTLGNSVGAGGGFSAAIFGGGGSFGRSNDITMAQTPFMIMDFNGDGLPDIIKKGSSNEKIKVWFNQGGSLYQSNPNFIMDNGEYEVADWKMKPGMPDSRVNLYKAILDQISLINGAAENWIMDAIHETADVLLISGGDTDTYSGTAFATIFFVKISTSYHHTGGYSFQQMALRDVTGDGLPDRVLRSGSEQDGSIQVQENILGGANLLKSIHRPLGGKIVLNYDRTIPSEDDPNARWVLNDYILDHEDSYPASSRTASLSETFEYEEPFYDRYEREFYGFKNVRTIQGDGGVESVTYENRDYRMQGLVKKSEIFDKDNNLFTKIENFFDPESLYINESQSERQLALENLKYPLKRLDNNILKDKRLTPCDVWFAKPIKTVTEWFEGGTISKQTAQHYEDYDAYGNVTRIREEQNEGLEDELIAIITYDHNPKPGNSPNAHQKTLLYAHIVDRVDSISVYQESVTDKLLRFRCGTYDDQGNLTKHEIYADSDGNKIATLNFEYDLQGTGFIIAVTDAVGYRLDYTPDTWYIFAMKSKDSFGLHSTTDFDYRFQLPTEQVDVNNQTQINKYDEFGRLNEVQGPYELAQGLASLSVNYSDPMNSFPTYAVTTNLAVVSGTSENSATIRTAIFMDGLGRTIQTQADAEVNGKIGRVISGKVAFDTNGRIQSQGQPIFRNGTNIKFENITTDPASSRITEWEYDIMDRVTKTTEPGNRITTETYDVSTHPRIQNFNTIRKKVIDPEGKIHIEHQDAMERLVAVVDVLNGNDLVTNYTYTPTGELTLIKDALDRVTTLEYDLAGNRIAITSPDAGRIELGYDANGNLIEKTDQVLCPQNTNLLESCTDNQKIRYEYDKNRLVSINYPTLPKVEYIYGDASVSGECFGTKSLGRICKIVDGLDTTFFSYGALGEIIEQKRIMQGAPWETTYSTFTTKYQYDSFGRMLSLIYPDGEKLTYKYDIGGRATTVVGKKGNETKEYVKDIQYDEYGQRVQLEYGNDVVTTYQYEPDTRRLDIENINSPIAVNPIRNIDYTYDKVGNITTILDNRVGTSPFYKKVDRSYNYDDLHRLKDFTLNLQHIDPTSNPTLIISGEYGYDDVGNITRKRINRQSGGNTLNDYPSRDWQYIYCNSDHPNLPDKIGNYNYTYDERGSILTSMLTQNDGSPLGATYTWNNNGRLLTSLMENQPSMQVTKYIYDVDGQRTRKQTPSKFLDPLNDPVDATVYPNEYYTARFAKTATGGFTTPASWEQVVSRSKHIYVNGQRVATTSMIINPTSVFSEDRLLVIEEVERFFHNDPVSSVGLLTDENGKCMQEIDYLPFGEILSDKFAIDDPGLPQKMAFDGKELDSETRLQYFGFRYYDPRIGRWISADPLYKHKPDIEIANSNTLNLFLFSGNNPIRFSDPTGLAIPMPRLPGESDKKYQSRLKKQMLDCQLSIGSLGIGTGIVAVKEAGVAGAGILQLLIRGVRALFTKKVPTKLINKVKASRTTSVYGKGTLGAAKEGIWSGTKVTKELAKQLGIDRRQLGKAIEKIKNTTGLRGNQNVRIGRISGDVWDKKTGEIIGNVFDEVVK